MKSLLVLLVLLCSGVAAAQVPADATTREIDGLFSALEHSSCQFERNGSWYGPAKAGAHLHRKYAWLRARGRVDSSEAFIDLAASKSSLSGQPYRVRCGTAAPVPSRDWFMGILRDLRRSHAAGAHAP